jgi:hypothetical protein
MDAQCDWGEAIAIIGGVQQTVQFFVMRLCYSRRRFVMTFPSQTMEKGLAFVLPPDALTHQGEMAGRMRHPGVCAHFTSA